MEVDERLRWLEARVSSSLHPRGDELRNLFADDQNRSAILAFCNHSESRKLYVYQSSEKQEFSREEAMGPIIASPTPPKTLTEKALIFLKCTNASKLNRENMGGEVVYSECSRLPLYHLELVLREVYLPMLLSLEQVLPNLSSDKLIDLIQRVVGSMQVASGQREGKVLLPLPSIEVLAGAAGGVGRSTLVHIMETCVVSWMKQVKVVLHYDPNLSIFKAHGMYAGSLGEYEFWYKRLASLEAVRNQLNTAVVLNVLRSLDRVQSTYAHAFVHVHRDIGKAIADCEHCLSYLRTLQPWLYKLDHQQAPEALVRVFPPLMTTFLLVWQHSGVYCYQTHFQRFLRLLSNDVMKKAKTIIGSSVLEEPTVSLSNLKLALRICAAFRGCYLDFREKAVAVIKKHREERESQMSGEGATDAQGELNGLRHLEGLGGGDGGGGGRRKVGGGRKGKGEGRGAKNEGKVPSQKEFSYCSWPPRNSPVFYSINGIMERCNDLLELVQTLLDFLELKPLEMGAEPFLQYKGDYVIADVYMNFKECMTSFQLQAAKDLLNIESDSSFEEHFYKFRVRVRDLEQRLVVPLKRAYDGAHSLPALLHVLELYQGISRREYIKACLQPQLASVVACLQAEIASVNDIVTSNRAHLPPLPLRPLVSSRLLWLHALKDRVEEPMEKIKKVAPELLEGDEGWKLRQSHGDLIKLLETEMSQAESGWVQSVPAGLHKKLRDNILKRDSRSGTILVNLDPILNETLAEVHYLMAPPMNLRLPTQLRQLMKTVDYGYLQKKQTSLAVIVQVYNELQSCVSDIDQTLLQHKLHQVEKMIEAGLEELDWLSTAFFDFTAKLSAAVCVDLRSTLDQVHNHIYSICDYTDAWNAQEGLDIFDSDHPQDLNELNKKHNQLIETVSVTLPRTMDRIAKRITHTFQCIHEASQESPAWISYLRQVDDLVLSSLRIMTLKFISTLSKRTSTYEQGGSIPSLVTVELGLYGTGVRFFPPLSTQSAFTSVPEMIQQWMSNYLTLARLVPKLSVGHSQDKNFELAHKDSDIKNAMNKICAHVETNCRQCQSLKKRFTIYSFMWEQDVNATFADFLRGRATPHPRRFTRPETVRSRASARAHSSTSRPKSSTTSLPVLPALEPSMSTVTGVTDWEFLRPDHASSMGGEEEPAHKVTLDDFDGEIAVFQGILERVKNIEDFNNVGWVCVDQRPIKDTLSSLANKWKHAYASHLERQIGVVLSKLESFFNEVEPQVDLISGEESDTSAFMKIMSTFIKVNVQQVEMDNKFGAVTRAVVILDRFGHPLSPDLRKKFNQAPQRWSNLKKRVSLCKQRIGPRIQAQQELISEDITRFGEIFLNLRGTFNKSSCHKSTTSRGKALQMLTDFSQELKSLQSQAKDLIELQELLQASIFNFSSLKEFEDELGALKELWNMSEIILGQHSLWSKCCWNEMESSELLSGTEKQLDLLNGLPPKLTQGWDIYQFLTQAVCTIQNTVPVLNGLKSPAMRPRHWKQVLRYATNGSSYYLMRGSTFDPSLLEQLSFGYLMEMELHFHQKEVLVVVERAKKDVAIESLLNMFEEVWLSRQLELKAYKRVVDSAQQEAISELGMETRRPSSTPRRPSSTPRPGSTPVRVTSAVRSSKGVVYAAPTSSTTPAGERSGGGNSIPLLSNTRGIFVTLESHQTSLQSLVGVASATSFDDELSKWHKQLQTIEAVLVTWLKVQQLWVQLEEVYSSVDVQQHLAQEAFTFSNVDREFRELMAQAKKNPAVLSICLKDDLLLLLEKLSSSLFQCQAALVRYMEGWRSKCPWFYLLPLEDILQLTCYSSGLQQFSASLSGVVHHIGSVDFSGGGSSHLFKEGQTSHIAITAVAARNGEQLELNQAVPCEGPVEIIVSKLLASISGTLRSHLSTLVSHSINPSPSSSGISSLHTYWAGKRSTQSILLATLLVQDISLANALLEAASSNSSQPLDALDKTIQNSLKVLSSLMQGKPLDGNVHGIKSDSSFGSSVPLESSDSQASIGRNQTEEFENSLQPKLNKNQPYTCAVLSRLQKIAVMLYSFRNKVAYFRALVKEFPGQDLTKTINWEDVPHLGWQSTDQKLTLSSLDSTLAVGGSYSSCSGIIMLDQQAEKSLQHVLLLLKDGHNVLLTGTMGVGKKSLVSHLSQLAGRPLIPLHCSSQVSHTTVFNHIRGMAATGCWLYLHSLDKLQPDVLQTACSLLTLLYQARQSGASSFQWVDETIEVFPENPGACLASITIPLESINYAPIPAQPTSVANSFKICAIHSQDFSEAIKMMFAIRNFTNADSLSKCLSMFCRAYREVFDDVFADSNKSGITFDFQWFNTIASLSQSHMRELYSFGPFDSNDSDPLLAVGTEGLHVPSIVYSEISEVTRVSLKEKFNDAEEEAEMKAEQRKCLEELSVVLALKDSILSSFPVEERNYSAAVMLMGEMFPSCDVEGLLVHEESVRKGMAFTSKQDRGAGESARESRAASVVQTLQDQRASYYAGFSKEHYIVHSCHLLHSIPSSSFQAAVSEIMSLVQVSQMVAVCGPSGCGKTAAIHVAAEALRQSSQTCFVGISTIAVEVMREDQLLGYQDNQQELWQEGVLPRCLSSILSNSPSDKGPHVGSFPSPSMAATASSYAWIVLEGDLSPEQMDALASCCQDGTLTLPNGHTINLDSSTTFIFEVTDCSKWTSSFSSKVSKVVMSQNTISWRDIILKWLNSLSEDLKPVLWDILEPLFEKYLPSTLQFISPVLSGSAIYGGHSGSSTGSVGGADPIIVPQELKLSALHVVNSCCQILESILPPPSPDNPNYSLDVEWSLVYAIIWGCGGFLTPSNKISFDLWWHATFSSNTVKFRTPKGKTIWDHYYKPGSLVCSTWDNSIPAFTLPEDKTKPFFVPTVRSTALAHLLNSLISRNIPVLLNGTSGSGKTSLLKYALSKHAKSSDASVLHIHCDQLTESHDIWNQIWDELEWDWGKKYKPKNAKRLVCFVDDIQNAGSSSTSELLREHLSTGFVCDANAGKWYQATGVCYVATTDHASKSSNVLTPQVLKHFVVLHWDSYSPAELVSILEAILQSHFMSAPQHYTISATSSGLTPHLVSAELCHNLAAATVQVYCKLRSMFLDIPERFHYSYVLKQLIGIVRHLCDKFPSSSTVEVQDILLEWQLVSWWKWAGQMSSEVDRNRYWEMLCHALKKFLDQDALLPVLLSQDSTALSQDTMDQLRTKLSSELMEYNYNMAHPTLQLNLYDGTVEEVHYLCRAIQSPPDLGHVLLLNCPHQEPKVRLAALHCGYTVTTTTIVTTTSSGTANSTPLPQAFSLAQFKSDLVSIYSTAGLKNEKILLLLTEKDIFHESFFSPVYKLVKDCAITTLFSKEEQAKIMNGVRGDLTHSGVAFSKETAWKFFLERVRNNVRVVVSLSELRQIMGTGVYKWKSLLNSISTYSELPWDRKKLIQVASYHLKECACLASGQMESLAHLLASIHLHLSSTTKIRTSNMQYQYYVERMVYKLNGVHKSGQLELAQLTLSLSCLSAAVERATKLHDRIQHEKVILAEKSEACVKLLTLIGQDTAISRQYSRLVVKQKERISHLKKVLPDFEHAYEQALLEKDDLIARSRQLVMEMHQEGLCELRSLQRPPADIEELLVGVITILKGTSADTSWTKGAKRIMANLDRFRELLLEFSAQEDNSDALLEALDPINAKPTFTEENFAQHKTFGLAASQLCSWVQGVIGLHSTLQTKVRPLQARAQSMKSSLADFSDKLKKEEGKVAVLEERLQGLSVALEGASVEKSKQNDFLKNMKKELKETEDFIQSLSGLQEIWERRLEESGGAVQLSAGVLCLQVALSCYLSSTQHHIQMELINVDLVPLLKERGMELHWELCNSFLSSMPSLSAKANSGAKKARNLSHTSEDDEKGEKKTDSTVCSIEGNLSKNNSPAAEQHMAKSFACLSECLLCHIIPEALVDEWLSLPVVFHSPCFLLFAGLIHNSWNKWPLLYDPQGFASNWINSYKEGVVYIDARDGSYESLEHAMVYGESVLLTHFSSPVDPLLLPVIELAHTWHNTKDTTRVILFGGHRLYVHDNFRLYLSTMTPPSSLPATLTCNLNVIYLDFSIPLGQDILLDAACRILLPEASERFMVLCENVAKTKSELRELDKNLFESLPKEEKTDSYWHSTEKIKDIMSKKDKLKLELDTLMQELRDCSDTMSNLLPIAMHASLSFDTAQKIAATKVFCTLSWEHFIEIFTKTLSDFTEVDKSSKYGESFWKSATEKDREEVQNEIIMKLNCGLVQEAFRTHDEHSYGVLVSSLFLLSQCDLTLESIPLLTHQLFYLSQGERTSKNVPSSKSFPDSSAVTSELCKILGQLPISKEYCDSIIESASDGDEFWVKVASREEMETLDISNLPIKFGEGNQEGSRCLDRLVFLRYLSEEAYLKSVMELSRGMADTVSIPHLADFLTKVMIKNCPSLLFYDEACPHSQAVLYSLEEEMQGIIQSRDKSMICLPMGAGVEEKASELLLQPQSDFLLLKNVQFTSREWRDRLLWRIRKAQQSGCCVVLTTPMSLSCPSSQQSVSNELVSACRTAHLSRMATSRTHQLPLQVWSVDTTCDAQKQHSFWALLVFNLANFPESLMQQCNSLKNALDKVVYRLFVVHTAASMIHVSGGELIPVHLSNLVACVTRLLSMDEGHIQEPVLLDSLVEFMRHIYSGCVTGDELEGVIQASIYAEPSEGHIQPLSGVQIKVWDQPIEPTSFLTNVTAGYKQHDFEKYSSSYSVRDAVDFVLLPTLIQATSSELHHRSQQHLPLPPGSCARSIPASCPEVVAMMSKWEKQRRKCKCKAIQETLETCSELLPHPLPLPNLEEMGMSMDRSRELETVSQLQCGELLGKFVHIKRVHQFNSKVIQIQEDIQALMDYSIIGFDGLSEYLIHVQASLEGEVMPKRWRGRGTSAALPVPLQEGFKMLLDYHTSLLLNVTNENKTR